MKPHIVPQLQFNMNKTWKFSSHKSQTWVMSGIPFSRLKFRHWKWKVSKQPTSSWLGRIQRKEQNEHEWRRNVSSIDFCYCTLVEYLTAVEYAVRADWLSWNQVATRYHTATADRYMATVTALICNLTFRRDFLRFTGLPCPRNHENRRLHSVKTVAGTHLSSVNWNVWQ